MRWNDRVYGDSTIDDPDVLRLIATPTFQRLKGIKQAGPSSFAHPFKTVHRFEHSLGVYLLLGRLGAGRRERVAGLLHDISHTAFSHAVDFLFDSDEQDHHESLKPLFLDRPDIKAALERLDFEPSAFYDDTIYPLLERPLPLLCADRLDYFLRDALACGEAAPSDVDRTLAHVVVADGLICFDDLEVARDGAERFGKMNARWWSGPVEAYIYNEFAQALRIGMGSGSLREDDLLGDDAHVMSCLRACRNPEVAAILERITRLDPEAVASYRPKVSAKVRWIDPPVVIGGEVRRLSEWD